MSHIPTPVAVAEGGTGASTASTARTNLGLGTIATQDANNVSISGGAIAAGALTSGTVATARLGSGTASSSTFLRGDQSWQNPVAAAWPVGSIFISTSSTNPGTSLGIGTWTSFGAGRVLVGLDAAQTEFDTVEETGGSKTVTLSTSEIPAHSHGVTDPGHNHTQNAHTHTVSVSLSDPGHNHTQNAHAHTVTITDPGHTHSYVNDGGDPATITPTSSFSTTGTYGATTSSTTGITASASSTTATNNSATTGISVSSASAGNTTATNNSATTGITTNNAGGGGAHTNLQPYIVVYMFKRTA